MRIRGARIGDMIHFILIHIREIKVPVFGSIDFSEDFTGLVSGDLLQIFIRTDNATWPTFMKDFRFFVNYIEQPRVITD